MHCVLANSKHAYTSAIAYPPATAEQVEAAGKVVRAFTRNAAFDPDYFPNPALDHHYKTLLAVAFDEELPKEVEDKTRPNYALIAKVSMSLIHRLCSSSPNLIDASFAALRQCNRRLERHDYRGRAHLAANERDGRHERQEAPTDFFNRRRAESQAASLGRQNLRGG